ncbi:MAG: hypothetical protein ACYS3S_19585 [Planctomycetota bacterium]
MEASGFLVRVIFLAVPGIVCYMLFRKLAGRSKCQKWEEWCKIILFSLIIYGTYSLLVWILGFFCWGKGELVFFKAILDEYEPIKWSEIIIASLIGVPVALIATTIQTYRVVNFLGRKIRVTKRSGDDDVWDYFHNLPDTPEHEWVFVRDHKTGLVYFGFIRAYSESEKERELLLGDVDVYASGKDEILYRRVMLFLCRDKKDLTIEIPVIDSESHEEIQDETKEAQ